MPRSKCIDHKRRGKQVVGGKNKRGDGKVNEARTGKRSENMPPDRENRHKPVFWMKLIQCTSYAC